MNIGHLLTLDCTITNVTQVNATVDQYNDPVPQSSAGTATVCWFHQEQRTDTTGLNDTQSERWTAYFPAGTTLDGHDRVSIDSVSYEVKGPPWEATNPRTGQAEFVVATLVRVS